MPVGGQVISNSLLISSSVLLVFKFSALSLAVLYFIFSLIVVRQVNLMTETVITEAMPVLKFFSIIHAGLALGVVILFIGFLFG